MKILARAVGRRKEAVAQIQIIEGTGQFIINNKSAQTYLQSNSCALISVKSPFLLCELISQSNQLTSFLNLDSSLQKNSIEIESKQQNSFEKPLETNPILSQVETFTKSTTELNMSTLEVSEQTADKDTNFLKFNFEKIDTIVKVKGGGLMGQVDAIKLGVSRALCNIKDLNSVKATGSLFPLTNLPKSDSIPLNPGIDDGLQNNEIGNLDPLKKTQTNLTTLVSENTRVESNNEELLLNFDFNKEIEGVFKKQLKTKGYLTQDSRVKERRKYGLKKARKASQYHKR